MEFNTYRSFFTNEALIGSLGGNYTMLKDDDRTRSDDGDEPGFTCEYCGCVKPVSQLHKDLVCKSCWALEHL